MAKSTKDLSLIALEAIIAIEVVDTKLRQLKGSKYDKGVLKQKLNTVLRQIEKEQIVDLDVLLDLDDTLTIKYMNDKQRLVEVVTQLGYLDQLEVLKLGEQLLNKTK